MYKTHDVLMRASVHVRILSEACVKIIVDRHNYQKELIPVLKVLRRAVLAFSYVIHSASCLQLYLKNQIKNTLLVFY